MTVERVTSPETDNDVDVLVAILEGDLTKRLEIFMRARDAFRKIIGNHADNIFNGLFEDPSTYSQHARCLLGRTREVMGGVTRDTAKAIIDLGRIEGFGFMTRLVEDAIGGGSTNGPQTEVSLPQEERASPRFVCGTELVSGRYT